jgi:tetratricopeptide (TPR) repeat protein
VRLKPSFVVTVSIALVAIAALAAWPRYVGTGVNSARAAALPTMAPVTPDYRQRDKLIAFWERATNEHHRGDMISPRMLAEQYLQRYRERYDVGDVLRAEHAARLSLAAQPVANLPAEIELASVQLTLHRFSDALATTMAVESWDGGDVSMYPREASLDMEIGDYATAERKLDAVPEKNRDDAWSVVDSRLLELTGHLAAARELLATASAFQNSNFDAPAQGRAWYFFRQGEMAFEAGDNDGAIGFEREALSIYPNDADASRTLARIECSLHEWDACLQAATASAAIVPYPETLGCQADAQRALGQTDAAKQTDDLIATVERLGDAQHITDRLTAIYYSDHGIHVDQAYAIARNELRSRDDIFTEDTLAWAAAMDGRWDEARRSIAKAERWHTENATIAYHAGVIDEHFGDRAGAKAEFARALALNAHFHPVYADDARQRLAAL